MSLMLTMDIIKQAHTCSPAVEEIQKYFTENNIQQVDFYDVIAYWKQIGRRDWAIWVYQNKKVFESISNSVAENNTLSQDDLDYISNLTFLGYQVGLNIYDSLEEAIVARQLSDDELKNNLTNQVISNLEVYDNNNNATWHVIDLDSFVPTDGVNWSIQVFNPVNGQYIKATTLEEAKTLKQQVISSVMKSLYVRPVVKILRAHPDYPDEIYMEVYDI